MQRQKQKKDNNSSNLYVVIFRIMLFYRIKAKLNSDTEAHWKKVSEVLSDASNYSIEEIFDMIKDE
jgi:hypothetical protein